MTVPLSEASLLFPSRRGPLFDPAEPSAGGTVTAPPATPPTPTAPPAPDHSARLAQLEQELAQAKADAQRWNEAKAVFAQPGTVDAGTQREAMARSLRAAGWQETAVQEYLQNLNGEPEPSPEQPTAKPRARRADENGVDPLQGEIDKLRRQVDDTSVRMTAYVRDGALSNLTSEVPEFTQALSAIKVVHGEGAAKNAEGVFRDEIKSLATQAFMKKTRDQGHMDPNWMLDAVKEAAKVVVRKHQWGIGDPNKVGRTPETGTGDPFAGKPPVPPPTFDPKRADQTDRVVEDFLADALPRLGQLSGGVPAGPSRA